MRNCGQETSTMDTGLAQMDLVLEVWQLFHHFCQLHSLTIDTQGLPSNPADMEVNNDEFLFTTMSYYRSYHTSTDKNNAQNITVGSHWDETI